MLPRLNGQLMGICPMLNDAALFLLSQQDNTVRIVNLASMKVVVPRSICTYAFAFKFAQSFCAPCRSPLGVEKTETPRKCHYRKRQM